MIPLRVGEKSATIPWATRAAALALLSVFVIQMSSPAVGEMLIRVFGFIPARLLHPGAFGYSAAEAGFTLVSSIFLHGGFVHLAGNLVFLWVFGSGLEARAGHVRFAMLALLSGVAGSLMHAFVFPDSSIPSIGASGSIAGILGAALVLEPRANVATLIPLVVSWVIVEVPAVVLLAVWFAMQFLNGWLALESARLTEEVAGIAWWAHVGGFLAGVAVGAWLRRRTRGTPLAAVL